MYDIRMYTYTHIYIYLYMIYICHIICMYVYTYTHLVRSLFYVVETMLVMVLICCVADL